MNTTPDFISEPGGQVPVAGSADLVVVGGGPAGISAASITFAAGSAVRLADAAYAAPLKTNEPVTVLRLTASVKPTVNASIPAGAKNQIGVLREQDAPITAADLLAPCEGERTEAGMRTNIRVALQYLEAWINGNGCVPIYGLMEDAATAEISRTSIWQWIRHGKSLSNGQVVTKALFRQMLAEEQQVVRRELGDARWQSGRFAEASELMEQITCADTLIDFLTLPGYERL